MIGWRSGSTTWGTPFMYSSLRNSGFGGSIFTTVSLGFFPGNSVSSSDSSSSGHIRQQQNTQYKMAPRVMKGQHKKENTVNIWNQLIAGLRAIALYFLYTGITYQNSKTFDTDGLLPSKGTFFRVKGAGWVDSCIKTSVTIMCRNDEIQRFLSYLQKIAKSFSKFLLFPFS